MIRPELAPPTPRTRRGLAEVGTNHPGSALLAGRRRVSSAGGDQPRWRTDSKELFFRTGGKAIASVAIVVREGRAEPERETLVIQEANDLRGYDVTPDGSRFLLLRASEDAVGAVSHVITRWQRLLAE